ncbi:Proteasome assembly chaperone 2 {ECO:0000256/PIRNR:PIRNR010044} [Serendipita indica DSM 11827]|uniref:Proteasome assembly chaperone 2 n=1 Tax=Serendipita indica (strain DSM 11827) TaxID=1109443 RepID=G4TT94_SERID|nr:Proteasome assembly chaperone 2 {ECO:0000256/PIRNR:PIRNR010044} [Serendipita indica DSM 11827]CCA74537.1 hypothetical protein PIIN_08489 [Serendipita indica DSM 11827]
MFIQSRRLTTLPDFTTKTLILPSISKGNVPQLACDLLIASLGLQHVGSLDPKYLVPVVGGRERGERGISTPLELFSSNDSPVAIVQQRSPVLKAYKEEFVKELVDWIQKFSFKSVVVLAGMDTTNRSDAQMQSPSYYLIPPSTSSLPDQLSERLSILPAYEAPPVPLYLQKPDSNSAQPKEDGGVPVIPGGGLARRILSSLSTANIPTLAILQFVMEGDNRGDAGMMVAVLNRVLDLDLQAIKEPGSWKNGLFGSNHDGSLFG